MNPLFLSDYESNAFRYFTIVCAQLLSCILLSATPWTVAHQAPLSMGFPRQEYWSGLPFHSPEDLPNPCQTHVSGTGRRILYHLSHQGSSSSLSEYIK